MPLQLDYQLPDSSQIIEDAFVDIELKDFVEDKYIFINARVYKCVEDRDSGFKPITIDRRHVSVTDENFYLFQKVELEKQDNYIFPQIYKWFKLQIEYSGAIDI